ncbi:MAG: hypothetical protein ABJF11_01140 [Reichenbachiella sp.]|uniref:hypothetical protein n=1 Tax=Reichenbachiella sp. TaxID=2184521 RepID=UPI003263D763
MKILAALLTIAFGMDDSIDQQKEQVFIYEYSTKIYGQAIIGFLIVDSMSNMTQTVFKLSCKGKKTVKIKKSSKSYTGVYERNQDEDFFLMNDKIWCYASENFRSNKKYSDLIYEAIDDDFMKVENSKRLMLLEDLINRSSSKE